MFFDNNYINTNYQSFVIIILFKNRSFSRNHPTHGQSFALVLAV